MPVFIKVSLPIPVPVPVKLPVPVRIPIPIPHSGFPLFQTPYPRFITATLENLYVVAYEMLNLLYILSSLF